MILTVNPRHLPITAWKSSTAKEFIFIISSPRILLDSKEIKPVHPKGNQPWIFIGRTDAEAEAPILWPPDVKNWLIWKDPDAGKDWKWEKGTTEDGMVGGHHWLNGHEFEQTLGVGDGQGSLVCRSPWGHNELDTAELLNWTESLQYSGWENSTENGAWRAPVDEVTKSQTRLKRRCVH